MPAIAGGYPTGNRKETRKSKVNPKRDFLAFQRSNTLYGEGMSTQQIQDGLESFVSLRVAAGRIGVPTAWLRGEAKARRIPHLRAGKRLLFNVREVEAALRERAARESKGGGA